MMKKILCWVILSRMKRFRPPMIPPLTIYFENIFSAINEQVLETTFDFLPGFLQDLMVLVINPFVGEGWHLTLGALFMLVVIFLPGGIMEGLRRLGTLIQCKKTGE